MSYDKRQHVREGMTTRTIPRPIGLGKTDREELFDAILEMYAGTDIRDIISLLKHNEWPTMDVRAFEDYYLDKGRRENWLYTEIFGD